MSIILMVLMTAVVMAFTHGRKERLSIEGKARRVQVAHGRGRYHRVKPGAIPSFWLKGRQHGLVPVHSLDHQPIHYR